jgi:hypothetical protein
VHATIADKAAVPFWRGSGAEAHRREAMSAYLEQETATFYTGRELQVRRTCQPILTMGPTDPGEPRSNHGGHLSTRRATTADAPRTGNDRADGGPSVGRRRLGLVLGLSGGVESRLPAGLGLVAEEGLLGREDEPFPRLVR